MTAITSLPETLRYSYPEAKEDFVMVGNRETNIWETAKGLGLTAFGLAFLLLLCAFILRGMAWLTQQVLPWLLTAAIITAIVSFVMLVPLSFFRATRAFSAISLLVGSYVVGIWTWWYGFEIAYNIWGWGGVIIGIFLGGVGLVPIAILAALTKAEWWIVFDLVFYSGLTFGFRFYSYLLAEKENN